MGNAERTPTDIAFDIIKKPKALVGSGFVAIAFGPTLKKLWEGAGMIEALTSNAEFLYSLPDKNWFQILCLFAAGYFLWSAAREVKEDYQRQLSESKRIALEGSTRSREYMSDGFDKLDALSELYVLETKRVELDRAFEDLRYSPNRLESLEKQRVAVPAKVKQMIAEGETGVDKAGMVGSINLDVTLTCRKISETREKFGIMGDWQADPEVDGVKQKMAIWTKAKAAIEPLDAMRDDLRRKIEDTRQKAFGSHE
ncbi:hypothetical protein [Citromicrobium bathyomarinum]|uniref:hypothetical protein n=1 Tax=Citromicrobium bathyomarinum TaxID=72174 RepID=UPI001E42A2A8|nr:hypothetical protein [Citromicrobium bathyomarinum]MCD1621569.1 hypothetical protein [Citromicrobium bathyomarinum]